MDLRKASPEERLSICSRYFYGGFAALPLLWAINAVWFAPYAFGPDSDHRIRRMVIISGTLSLICLVAICFWITWFQNNRDETGTAFWDEMSVNIPKGKA